MDTTNHTTPSLTSPERAALTAKENRLMRLEGGTSRHLRTGFHRVALHNLRYGGSDIRDLGSPVFAAAAVAAVYVARRARADGRCWRHGGSCLVSQGSAAQPAFPGGPLAPRLLTLWVFPGGLCVIAVVVLLPEWTFEDVGGHYVSVRMIDNDCYIESHQGFDDCCNFASSVTETGV